MFESKARGPAGPVSVDLPREVEVAMWALFVAIGRHWDTENDSIEYRSRLRSFMTDRVMLMPIYADYYAIATRVFNELVDKHAGNAQAACAHLLADAVAAKQPPSTPLALTRQLVASEFVALHMALGACTVFGAKNGVGFFGGANVPGAPAPYRTRG